MSVKNERVSIFIDSKDKTSGSTENFEIKLEKKIDRVLSVEIVSVEIPYSFYTINSSNNIFKFTDNTPTIYTVTITPGNYDAITFASTLQTAMNLLMAGFTVSYSITTYKLSFSNASQFNILYSTSTIAEPIGLTADSTLTTSFTCQGTINLSGPNYIVIESTALSNPRVTKAFLSSAPSSAIYKMVVSTGPGTTLIEKNVFLNPISFGARQGIQTIDLVLKDPNGTVLDLNGQRWSMTIVANKG
jgi:hypothetical protein